MITVIVTTKATRTDALTTDVLPHMGIQVVSGPVGTVVLTKVIVVVKVTVDMVTSGVHLLVTDHDHPIMAVSQEGTGMEDQCPHTLTSHLGLGSIPRDERHYGYQSPRFDDRGYQPQPFAGPPQ
ncbi:unnamed protein product [Phytophthora fragariaefolia]|uniref:Unnamed protein product n=1 Tax=Phytophthora fragariaefolia TaxID=1490495 RepID=A0A9W7CYC7_9STRA|nr:unnamed protein product [Phytophthora fragariaefolia]